MSDNNLHTERGSAMDALLTLEQCQSIPAIPVPAARPVASLRYEERDESDGGPSWVVDTRWEDVSVHRTVGLGWSVGAKKKRLAERLAAAIDAGVVFGQASIRTDVYGRTYIDATARVMGRYLNADLNRLGY